MATTSTTAVTDSSSTLTTAMTVGPLLDLSLPLLSLWAALLPWPWWCPEAAVAAPKRERDAAAVTTGAPPNTMTIAATRCTAWKVMSRPTE